MNKELFSLLNSVFCFPLIQSQNSNALLITYTQCFALQYTFLVVLHYVYLTAVETSLYFLFFYKTRHLFVLDSVHNFPYFEKQQMFLVLMDPRGALSAKMRAGAQLCKQL